MEKLFKDFLFSKNIFVNDYSREQEAIFKAYTLYSLAEIFGVKIISGQEHLDPKMLQIAQRGLEIYTSQDYSSGFSDFVNELSSDKAFLKQMESYFENSKEDNSILVYEEIIQKLPFNKDYRIREFSVVTKLQAEEILGGYVFLLKTAKRALSDCENEFLKAFEEAYGNSVFTSAEACNESKQIAFSLFEGEKETISTGFVIHIEKGKKIRFFTCWKKKDYIDFEILALDSNGKETGRSTRVSEFTKIEDDMPFVVFSSDKCRYIDIDFDKFKEQKPEICYLLIRDAGKFLLKILEEEKYANFEKTPYFCKTGFVLRDIDAEEEIFTPETVDTPYAIDYEKAKLYFWGIDLKKNNVIWLNLEELEDFDDIVKKYFIS